MATILVDLFKHHDWANQRLRDVGAALGDDDPSASVPGTFGNVRDTLAHVIANEEGNLARMTGGPPPSRADFAVRGIDDLRQRPRRGAERWIALADRAEPTQVIRGRCGGERYALPVSVFLIQILSHAAEHRAQVVTILEQRGIEPPALDGWTLAEEGAGAA